MEPAATSALYAGFALDDTPASLRRLVLLPYGLAPPPSVLLVLWTTQPARFAPRTV